MKLAKFALTPPVIAISVALCAALSSFADGRVIYVKPDGDAAASGESWAQATTLAHAFGMRTSGDEIRMAKGVHLYANATMNMGALTMRGGYDGLADDEEPTGDRYSTVVTGDAMGNDVWLHVDPVTGTEDFLFNDGQPLYVVDPVTKTFNLPPAWTGDYDCYYPVNYDATKGTINKSQSDNMPSYSGDNQSYRNLYVFENFTLTGIGKGDTGSGPPFFDVSGVNDSIFRNLAVIGCSESTEAVLRNNGTGTHLYEDIVYRHCRGWQAGLIGLYSTAGDYHVKNIEAEGIYSARETATTKAGRGVVIAVSAAKLHSTIENVRGKRLVYDGRNATGPDTTAPALAIGISGGIITTTNCVFSGCWSASVGENPVVYGGANNTNQDGPFAASFADITISNCYAEVVASGENAAVGGFARNSNARPFFTGWLMKDNVMKVTAGDGVKRLVAAPFLFYSEQGMQKMAANMMFDNNSCEVTAADTVVVDWSRALAYRISGSNNNVTFTVVNSSFAGATPGSDLVFAAANGAVTGCYRTSFVLDSIFSSTCPGYVPVRAFEPNHLAVRNCIVPNMDTQAEVANVELSGVNYWHDPMLVYDADQNALVPTVKVTGIDTSSAYNFQTRFGDGLVCTNLYQVMMRNGNTSRAKMTAQHASLLSTYDARQVNYSYDPATYPDARLNARPDDAPITLGAMQVGSFPEGCVVASTVEPYAGGTVSPASQTIASGGSATLTVTEAEGYKFKEWRDENDAVIGTDLTLVTPAAGLYKTVRAVFGAPKTKITLSLDGKGTFDDSGKDTYECEAEAFAPFPDIPAFTANAGWAKTDVWSPLLPSTVPEQDSTYVHQFMPEYRAVCFDSHATGTGDGTSWANACTDFAAAMTLAGGASRSDLKIRCGVHLVRTTAKLPDGVTVRGGYTGVGDERTDDRWATVLTGDVNGDDAWTYDDGTSAGKVLNDDGTFNRPNADGAHEYQVIANFADNTTQLVDGNVTDWKAVRGIRFEGFTATGFGRGATRGSVLSTGPFFVDYVVSNCAFVANNGMNGNNQGVLAVSAQMTLADCTFVGNMGTAIRCHNFDNLYPVAWENGVSIKVYDTVFEGGYASGMYSHTAGVGIRTGGGEVKGCTFVRNYCEGAYYYYPGTCIGREGNLAIVANCRFEGNIAKSFSSATGNNNNMPTTLASANSTALYSSFSNCLFRANRVIAGATDSLNPSLLVLNGHILRCSFVSNTVEALSAKVTAPLLINYGKNGTAFANSTFVGNRVTATADGAVTALAGQSLPFNNNIAKSGFANCTLLDNDVDAVIRNLHTAPLFGFGNCVVWHRTAPSVRLLSVNNTALGYFWSNTFKGYDPATDDSIVVKNDDGRTLNDDPLFGELEYSDDGLNAYVKMHKGLSSKKGAGADIRYRNGLATSFGYCQYLFKLTDTGKWDAVNEPGQNLTPERVMTWDILADDVRPQGEANRGSVQGYIPNGLQILVR